MSIGQKPKVGGNRRFGVVLCGKIMQSVRGHLSPEKRLLPPDLGQNWSTLSQRARKLADGNPKRGAIQEANGTPRLIGFSQEPHKMLVLVVQC